MYLCLHFNFVRPNRLTEVRRWFWWSDYSVSWIAKTETWSCRTSWVRVLSRLYTFISTFHRVLHQLASLFFPLVFAQAGQDKIKEPSHIKKGVGKVGLTNLSCLRSGFGWTKILYSCYKSLDLL